MSVFTSVGSGLWSWEPFRRLERHQEDLIGRCSKLLWLALYTSPQAKLLVPGLFTGSVTTIAESARMPVDDVRRYLDRLIEDDMIEYDVESCVLRLTVLPDCGESPSNGRAIRGWWRRFQTVHECPVRDAHVAVLRWIMDEWSRRNGKPFSNDHAVAWSETFGRISVPPLRRRAPRHIQTSLFTASGSPDPKINHLDTNKCSTPVVLDPDPDPDPDQDQDLRVPEVAKVLQLVPAQPFDADDLATTLYAATGGRFPQALTKATRLALGRAIDASGAIAHAPDTLALLREYIARHGISGITPEAVAAPGWLAITLERVRTWHQESQAKSEMLAAAMAQRPLE